ncbi:ABC transporter substrate-binding protein [Haladaptatus pallidirubidus]|uniref:Solute-binding protein family 5 domain-containing protein n=1 Tax=Haladaptatus pallidirubidus TaxID=1008152 RepID=A0AAV3URZ7_9EURY|nr:ABC transporter substrate-binding protein [Haladaptatus pallidirubidus]
MLVTTGALGITSLAGCGGIGDSGDGNGSGDGRSVKTMFRSDWPVETKNNDNIPFEYTVTEGSEVPEITVNFASDEEPWMREHAIMIQRAFEDIGVPVQLDDVPTNVMYDEVWAADTGQTVSVSMNTHGPDPQRGLDPNPFLMRMHPENAGNYYNYSNEEITKLLDDQATEIQDKQRRAKLCHEIQRKASDDAYILSIAFTDVIMAGNTNNWNGYVPTAGNGTNRDSFIWTQVNLQPQGNSSTWVKGVMAAMGGLNIAWAGGGPEAKRLTNLYDGLFDASPQLEVVPGLATNAEVVDDTTVEMDLRKGVKWHDGESFGPDDVKFSVELFKEYSAPEMGPFYEPIDSVEVLSQNGGGRVRFNLTQPDAAFLTQRVVRSVILPKHRWKDVNNPAKHNPDQPVGTGPFKFKNWEQGTRFEVEKHGSHWLWNENVRKKILGEHFVPGDGIDGIVWSNVGNVDALIGAMQSGDIDAIGTTLSNSQADRAAESKGVEKQVSKNYAPLDVHINHINPLVRDKVFRKALSHAVDKKGFVEGVLGGRGTVIKGQNLISPMMSPFYTEDIPAYEYNPEKGKQMLEKAGYSYNGDTLQAPSGKAWGAFEKRVKDGHADRSDLEQADFS